ncbi:putative methyltransferase-domain-containing protein [Blakeslea trispora]|nr:putative methyltransferase-domain-containing protein [Blakeslea trispora]
MSLEDHGQDEIELYRVHPQDLVRARQYTNAILLKLISLEYLFNDDQDDERMERASRLLAHMSGRGGNDLGFKTWGAAPMMAKKLLQENIIPHLADASVLELGTGTGMVGLVCDYLGAAEVHVTDYHPRVLENVAYNIQLNQSRARVSQLDFVEVALDQAVEWQDRTFDVVIASDLLYEMEHAEHLPLAIDRLMKNEFYFMIPLRDTHWEEVSRFEQKMKEIGLICKKTQDSQHEEEEGMIRFRYYEFVRTTS